MHFEHVATLKARRATVLACAALAFALMARPSRATLGEAQYVTFAPSTQALALVHEKAASPILVHPQDWPGVVRVAHDLQADVERVTGIKPELHRASTVPPNGGRLRTAVIVGTVGRSPLIDDLVGRGKLDVSPVRGRWESWVREVIDQPMPGIDRALVIAGSDKRGAIYGVYDLSQQLGVSPWYWWADVVPDRHDSLYVAPGRFVQGPPSVMYRGIFLNDEAPDLTNWVRAKFGDAPVRSDPPVPPGIANYGREFYTRMFEVLLRLRANYLWPAMWNNAFNEDDPENARLADEYGIVMGTSHQEPMLRAQKEWDRRFQKEVGTWNYAKHPELLEQFWREGVRRNRAFESIITLGLRGANDTEMAPGGPEANRALLEHIVDRQRRILREEVNADLTRIPQLWCLYKEVQDYYEAGMRVPDDVTLLWAEDNWGNVRRLPTAEERGRPGGAGVYYHFDYHGGPRSYQWINTNPLPKIWEQMSLAKAYGADRIWIVNAGHFKGNEVPTEFFLAYAWNTDRWHHENLDDFLRLWAAREFGSPHAADIAEIVSRYAKYNGRRKPEMLAPDTYSLVNYREAESVVADFKAIAARAGTLAEQLPPAKRDAYYQLVQFPTQASALVNELYHAAGRNALYARQGRANARAMAVETHRLFQADLDLMAYFNRDFADGRWAHFMDQTHLGYTTWRDPPQNSLDAIPLIEPAIPPGARLGVAIEGSEQSWPTPQATRKAGETTGTSPASAAVSPAELPSFDAINQQRRYIEVFRRGDQPFAFTATPSGPWIRLSETSGNVDRDRRIWVSIDWSAVPSPNASGTIRISGAGTDVVVRVNAVTPEALTRAELDGFVEDSGVVSIEPEHVSRNISGAQSRWVRVEDYGRTLSGMRAESPPYVPSAQPGKDAAVLEYRVYLFDAGPVEVTAITSPTLNFMPDRGLRYAVSFDDQPPQVMTLVPQGYRAENRNLDWEKTVGDNARYSISRHNLAGPGYHTLKIWAVDPAVVLQKLIINRGGLKPSYLGPPESLRGSAVDRPPSGAH